MFSCVCVCVMVVCVCVCVCVQRHARIGKVHLIRRGISLDTSDCCFTCSYITSY